MPEYRCKIKDGKIPREVSENVKALFKKCKDGDEVVVSVSKYRRQRTKEQNAYLWGVVYPTIIRETGTPMNGKQLHAYLKEYVGKLVTYVKGLDGEVRKIVLSSKDLKVDEMSEYIERVIVHAAEYDVMIPSPNQHLLDRGE